MKDCGDYRECLRRYLDKELSGPELTEYRAHLEACPVCREELTAEEELSRLLARSRPLYTAPDSLRSRVLRVLGEPESDPRRKRGQ
jgi:mycothiol system anti-sigma-R factor